MVKLGYLTVGENRRTLKEIQNKISMRLCDTNSKIDNLDSGRKEFRN